MVFRGGCVNGLQWQDDGKGRAGSWNAGDGDVSSENLAEATADGESESGSAVLSRCGCIRLTKRLKQLSALFGCHPDTGVLNGKGYIAGQTAFIQVCTQGDGAIFRELGCITQQVEKRLADLCEVTCHRAELGLDVQNELVVVLRKERLDGCSNILDQ